MSHLISRSIINEVMAVCAVSSFPRSMSYIISNSEKTAVSMALTDVSREMKINIISSLQAFRGAVKEKENFPFLYFFLTLFISFLLSFHIY